MCVDAGKSKYDSEIAWLWTSYPSKVRRLFGSEGPKLEPIWDFLLSGLWVLEIDGGNQVLFMLI